MRLGIRDLMQHLLERRYRVQAQVGSLGYRIDMVVEGADGTRLAVECDGDRFHGPEQWQHDMRRQRTLERVGWRFWRCFASTYYRNSDLVVSELVETLTRMGIEPTRGDNTEHPRRRFTEHRTIEPPAPVADPLSLSEIAIDIELADPPATDEKTAGPGVAVGDKVVLLFSDDQKRISVRVTDGANDLQKGRLSLNSPLGVAILGAEEGDEVELSLENGRQRKVLIEAVTKGSVPIPAVTDAPAAAVVA